MDWVAFRSLGAKDRDLEVARQRALHIGSRVERGAFVLAGGFLTAHEELLAPKLLPLLGRQILQIGLAVQRKDEIAARP